MKRSTSLTIALLLLASLLSIIHLVKAENFMLLRNGISSFTYNRIPIKGVANISAGVNVTVYPTSDLELIFPIVTVAGYVTADKTSTVEAPLLADLVGQYCDVRVTATYSGTVVVSLTYDDSNMTQQQESSLQMMQYTPILGDIVLDYGRVNILDISFIAKYFGKTSASPGWDATADITGDGVVNIIDLGKCAKNFSKTAEWTNITTYVDTELNIVHGETTHFSIFGIHS